MNHEIRWNQGNSGLASMSKRVYTSHGQRLSISERLKVECEQ